jgi:hypothetical protein
MQAVQDYKQEKTLGTTREVMPCTYGQSLRMFDDSTEG